MFYRPVNRYGYIGAREREKERAGWVGAGRAENGSGAVNAREVCVRYCTMFVFIFVERSYEKGGGGGGVEEGAEQES